MVARSGVVIQPKACVERDWGAGDIIHTEGVRVDFPSSAPDAVMFGPKVSLPSWRDARELVTETRLMGNDGILSRIEELKTTIAEGVIACEIRKRSARVQVLQNTLDRMRNLIEARAIEYADHLGGATRMLVKDYRGKNAEQEISKFDAALVAQINDVLKQAAIEEGQWTEKRDAKGSVGMSVIMERLNAGRKRVADAKAARDAAALTKLRPDEYSPTS